ncbi:MAG: phosphoglucosamine mutase [Acidobacteriota bacterium]
MSQQRPRYFGTDGIRGTFGVPPLDETSIRILGAALGQELALGQEPGSDAAEPRVMMGGDTRDSTPTICRWLTEELTDAGCEVGSLGVVPTPGVAFATRTRGASCGVVVSASHNPHPDNGIKLIDSEGFKWDPEAELNLENRMSERTNNLPQRSAGDGATSDSAASDGAASGVEAQPAETGSYIDAIVSHLPNEMALAGLSVVLDTGNGAASSFAGPLFERLGARVTTIHDSPNGSNVNAGCGSTHPEVVAREVATAGADLGFAFDGDADRVILVDETGSVCDGDAMLFLWAQELKRTGQLPHNKIVATSMSNLGLEVALRRLGIEVVRCDVGDRIVVETMRREGIVLGGEQSGHIINLSQGTTGDGMATAVQIAALRQRHHRPMSQMLSGFERFPQLLRSIAVQRKPELTGLPPVRAASRAVEEALGADGRLVLRYSGTEPLVRIMIEGSDRTTIESLADDLERVLVAELS